MDSILPLLLRLKVAGFTAIEAIVLAVLAQADIELTHAQGAKAVALAILFRLVTRIANELGGHIGNVAQTGEEGKSGLYPYRPLTL